MILLLYAFQEGYYWDLWAVLLFYILKKLSSIFGNSFGACSLSSTNTLCDWSRMLFFSFCTFLFLGVWICLRMLDCECSIPLYYSFRGLSVVSYETSFQSLLWWNTLTWDLPPSNSLFADITELNLPRSCTISFPDGKDKLMSFEIKIQPGGGYYA